MRLRELSPSNPAVKANGPKPQFSFLTILFLVAIVGIVPTLIFSGLLLLRYAESERERAEHVLVENARGVARAVDAVFIAAEAALAVLRDATDVEEDNLERFELRLRRTAATTGRHYVLVDANGQQKINTFRSPGEPLPKNDPELWRPVFSEGQTHVTNVFEGITSKQLLVGVGVPVFRNGEVKWALSTGLFAKDFERLMHQPGVPQEWIVSIVDRTGRHIFRSHNNDQFAGKPLVPALVDQIRRIGIGTLRTTSLEGIPLISTVQFAPNSRWAAAVGLPASSLERPIMMSLGFLAAIGTLFTAAALGLALLVARLLNRSVERLTDMAAALGRGQLVEPEASRITEVNVIGQALAHTSRDLNELKTKLESQVAERTAELTTTNEHLVAEIKRRKESEGQVVQMQKIEAVGQLTGGIAHDFNNMLAIILGSLRLLQRRLERGSTDVQKYIDGAIQGAERAASLTARLLAFSRQQPLAPEVIDVNKLLAGLEEVLRRTIPESVQIETVLTGGVWRISADVQGLESAIINLAANARDAMLEGGKLTIESANVHLDDAYAETHADAHAGQFVKISVIDNGEGMSQEVIDRVFDPFYTTKPTGQGTGLGLSQVHGFIKQSGGHVEILSAPKKGTTVNLYLSRHVGNQRSVDGNPRQMAYVPRARNGEMILVVEDEPDVRKLTVEMLQELNYRTIEAESAAEALVHLDEHPEIDLLLTDVVMPGMNGRQLANEALARRPDLAVLFTTGYTGNAIMHHGVLDPDVHLLMKPHTLEMLAQKVSELLHSDAARQPKAG